MEPDGLASRFYGDCSPADNEVHVWRTSLNSSSSDFAALQFLLSPDEVERAERLHFEADRRRSILGRGFLRLLLGEIMNFPASSLRFEYDEFGKPRLTPTQENGLRFNVSHSGDLILVAVTRDRAVGVDVERIRADIDLDGVAARFFSVAERERLALLAGQARYEGFFTCWTRKEAYLKANGFGLSMPLDQFDVSLLPKEQPRLLETRHNPGEAERWTLLPVDVPFGYAATVAAEGSDWTLKCRDWPRAITS